jgi:integrase
MRNLVQQSGNIGSDQNRNQETRCVRSRFQPRNIQQRGRHGLPCKLNCSRSMGQSPSRRTISPHSGGDRSLHSGERLVEILAQPPGEVTITEAIAYSTAAVYTSFLTRHIRPRWENTCLSRIKSLEVMDWLKTLKLAPKSKAHLKGMLHLLFERAMLWDLVEVARNPLELVRVKGGSKREKLPTVLTPEEFQEMASHLAEPYRVMATVAVCTGLRISEVLALRWEHIDFNAGTMLVQQGVVNGRIGKTKTEASRDEIPLDGDFAQALLNWKAKNPKATVGLVFPSRYRRMLPCWCDYAQAHQPSRGEDWSQ